jgi:hypothetical protein
LIEIIVWCGLSQGISIGILVNLFVPDWRTTRGGHSWWFHRFADMLKNTMNSRRFGYEGNDLDGSPTKGTKERKYFINTGEEYCPKYTFRTS